MVIKRKFGRYLKVAPFFSKINLMSEDNKKELRPSKMRGVVFPKAKYGLIFAILTIILVSIIFYKDSIISFLISII